VVSAELERLRAPSIFADSQRKLPKHRTISCRTDREVIVADVGMYQLFLARTRHYVSTLLFVGVWAIAPKMPLV
jgi:hypothetical protein